MEQKTERTLYGGVSQNCCGYCRLHGCGVTVKQLRKKECLQKQCFHLRRYAEHDFWRERERVHQLRLARRARLAAI